MGLTKRTTLKKKGQKMSKELKRAEKTGFYQRNGAKAGGKVRARSKGGKQMCTMLTTSWFTEGFAFSDVAMSTFGSKHCQKHRHLSASSLFPSTWWQPSMMIIWPPGKIRRPKSDSDKSRAGFRPKSEIRKVAMLVAMSGLVGCRPEHLKR